MHRDDNDESDPMTNRSNDETTTGAARETDSEAAGCTGCELPSSRRRFLRDTFLSMAGALVAVGVSRTTAFAMPLEFTEGTRDSNHAVSYAIPAADGAQIDKKNEVILVRWQGSIYAFNLSCPHQNSRVVLAGVRAARRRQTVLRDSRRPRRPIRQHDPSPRPAR